MAIRPTNIPEVAPPVRAGSNLPDVAPSCLPGTLDISACIVLASGALFWPQPPLPPAPVPGPMATETGEAASSEAFANLADIASGGLEFRLVIEGVGTVFATNEDMAGTDLLGRTVVPGLSRDGLGFSERVFISSAEQDVGIDTVNVDEVGGSWRGVATSVFSTIANRIVGLSQTLGVDGPMRVPDTGGTLFTVGHRYYLGTETVKVVSIDATSDPEEIVLERGQWGSTAQEHPVAVGAAAMATSVYDAPTGMQGRRVWLYAHTADELSPLAEGTIVWRGVLSREPTLSDDTLSWSLGVEPRTRLLEASLAGGYDQAFELRGIYYSGLAPLYISFRRWSTAGMSGTYEDAQVVLSGFFESQSTFAAGLQAAIDANATIAGWTETIAVRAFADSWDIAVTTGGTPFYIQVGGGTYVDGYFLSGLQSDPGADTPSSAAVPLTSVSASTTYVAVWDFAREGGGIAVEDQRHVPRSQNVGTFAIRDSDANIALAPAYRLYLSNVGALSSGDDITITTQVTATGALVADDTPPQVVRVSRVLSSVGAIEATEGGDATHPPNVVAAGSTQPTLNGSARYAGGDGDLADLRDDLIARAPVLANRGKAPWVTSDDIADWHDAVTEVGAGRDWLDHRAWTFAKPVKAIEVLREEWSLYGLIPYLDENARLAVRPFTAGGSAINVAIGEDGHLVDRMLGGVSGEADGLVTVVDVLTNYDAAEDKHLGTITYRGLEAIARVHAERKLQIAPKSRAVGAEPDEIDLFDRGRSIISLFGDRRTQVVTFEVSLRYFSTLIGDTVSLTIPALPSDGYRTEWNSGLGMLARVGTLIGRSWDLGEGVGTFTVLLHELDLAGYAPCCKVTGASGSGVSWTLQVAETHYSTSTDSAFFASGDSVVLVEWGSQVPTRVEGVVVGTPTATAVVVSLDGAWSGFGTATRYTLLPGDSSDADTSATQLRYAYDANAARRIPLSSGSSPAQVFAP